MEKEQRQTDQPVATQGFSDLSLLCHKGTHFLLRLWNMEWTSRPSPPSSAMFPAALH